MKKTDDLYKKHNVLSKHESLLLNAVDAFLLFSVQKIKRVTGWKDTTIRNTLLSLKKKRTITAVKKDKYVLTTNIPEHILKIATTITAPSYVSFWTACSYYGWTEQQVKTIQVVSTKQFPTIKMQSYGEVETITVLPKRMFGYCSVEGISIAEKERLIVDLLYKPEKSGGISELKDCITRAWSEINQKKLFLYLKQFGDKALFARLGYILEERKLKNTMEVGFLKNIPKSYTPLYRENREDKEKGEVRKKGVYNHTWRIVVYDQ
ncbi:hypothetical protein HZC31_04915 [Candidatus Woesearchaeota archaeon]|nr:hypothetical protein [Candidatus Woesearchaeota archaeon]